MRVLVWICEMALHIYIVPELYPVVNGRFKANLVYGFELQELFALLNVVAGLFKRRKALAV